MISFLAAVDIAVAAVVDGDGDLFCHVGGYNQPSKYSLVCLGEISVLEIHVSKISLISALQRRNLLSFTLQILMEQEMFR